MKRLLIPVILLIVIGVIWLVQSHLEEKKTRGTITENFLGLNADEVDRVEIINPSEKVVLFAGDDGQWYLESTPKPRLTDQEAVKTMLENSAKINVGKIISSNPDNQAELDVSDSSGIRVNFYHQNDTLNSIILGKLSPTKSHTFVRIPGEVDVYEAIGPVSMLYDRPFTGWLDRTVISLLSGTIKDIEVKNDTGTYKLIRADSAWVISKPPYKDSLATDEMAVETFLDVITDIRATDFINASDSGLIDFEKPSLIVSFDTYNDAGHNLVFGKTSDDNTRIYVKRDDLDETYVIRKSRFGSMNKPFDYFIPKS